MSEGRADVKGTRWWQWWPALLGAFGVVFCIVAHYTGNDAWLAKRLHEVLAISISATALLAAVTKLALVRHRFYILLSLLAFFVLFREIHIDGTKKVIYIAVAGLSVWAYIWRRQLLPFIEIHRQTKIWLIATACTYVFSQFIARRGFQHMLPDGSGMEVLFEELYDDMEEVVENIGHTLLFITAMVGPWRRLCRDDNGRPSSGAPSVDV